MNYFWTSETEYHALGQDEFHLAIRGEVIRTKFPTKRACGVIFIALLMALVLLLFFDSDLVYSESMHCVQPRYRQEWRTLSETEQHEYIAAVQCLNGLPAKLHDFGHIPDDFAWVHVEGSYITHYRPTFLLWHRYFIWLYEERLRRDCGYSGSLPYWDWAQDSHDPSNAPIWDNVTGFGGSGSGEKVVREAGCVPDGPFAQFQLQFINEDHQPHCLSRGFNFAGEKFAPHVVEGLYAFERLTDFSDHLEENSHDAIPNGIGGDFATFTAPGDPVWFLHHSNIDRLFWKWQAARGERRDVLYLSAESDLMRESLDAPMPMLGLASDMRTSSMIDCLSDQLCYAYI